MADRVENVFVEVEGKWKKLKRDEFGFVGFENKASLGKGEMVGRALDCGR
jgi:hypothetical protein